MAQTLSPLEVKSRIDVSVRSAIEGKLHRLEFQAMSTVCRILSHGASDSTIKSFQKNALAWITQFESRYSRFVPDSLVTRLNSMAGKQWVPTTPEDDSLLDLCDQHFTLSGGIFDVTALPLIQLWNWKQRPAALPDASVIAKTQELVGWNKVRRRAGGICLPETGMAMDLGGIGKEYAVDQILELAKTHAVPNVLVDFGQDIRVLGSAPDQPSWKVGLEDPQRPGACWVVVMATDHAVATSGNYRRHFEVDGRRYGHIIDPRTGFPTDSDCLSATVIAPTCSLAGLYATVICVLGTRAGLEFVPTREDFAAAALTLTEKLGSENFKKLIAH